MINKSIYSSYLRDPNIEGWRKDLLVSPTGLMKSLQKEDPLDFIQCVVYELDFDPNLNKWRKSFKGENHTEGSKRLISQSLMGHIVTKETRGKLSLAHKGRKHTEETKKKIGEGNKGKRHTEEAKEKMRVKAVGRTHTDETKKHLSEMQVGKKLSNEHRNKISNVVKGRIHVTNGVINKFVHPENIPSGFYKGRTVKKKS